MSVYNITMKVEPEISAEWLRWQFDEHIPDIMATGLFFDNNFYRLIEDENSFTYVAQYFTDSREKYDRYISHHAPVLRKKATEKWGERFIAWRTLMETVH